MMEKEDQQLAFAIAAMMGLVARGATPTELRDMLPVYVDYAMIAMTPEEEK
jgi:hypothetical protein